MPATEIDHGPWDRLLRTHVDERGRVAYRDLAARDRAVLTEYLASLAAVDAGALPRDAAKAFWINAYNAAVVSAILEGYSAESFFRRRALFKRFTVEVAGKKRTLDEIEHEIIRPTYRDPRTHAALVCASSSCPRLRRAAYTAADLEHVLDEEMRLFVTDRSRNVIDPAAAEVRLSAIFSWFSEDFVADAGSVGAYVGRWVATDAERALLRTKADDLEFLDYDWSLNAQPGQRPDA